MSLREDAVWTPKTDETFQIEKSLRKTSQRVRVAARGPPSVVELTWTQDHILDFSFLGALESTISVSGEDFFYWFSRRR